MGVRLQIESGWTADSRVSLSFDQDRIVVGRRGGCDVQLPHAAVSGHHATIRSSGPRYSVIDENSTNGVRVNGERIVPGRAKLIDDGDVLDIGGFSIVVSMEAVANSTSADGTAAAALRLFRSVPDEEFEPASLFFVNGSRAGDWLTLPAPPSSWTAGRGEEAELHIDDADVSREHAELVHDLEGVVIRDLGSKNGVLVGGRNVRSRRLHDGDEITLGATILRFDDPASAALAAMLGDDDVALSELPVGPSSPSAEPPPKSDDGAREDDEHTGEGSEESELSAASDDLATNEAPPAGTATSTQSVLPTAPGRGGGADVAIYALAGTVLALSLAGLYWLFTSQ